MNPRGLTSSPNPEEILERGARFAKGRAVINIDKDKNSDHDRDTLMPTRSGVTLLLCQAAQIVSESSNRKS